MKSFVSCDIEILSVPGETAWVISIPTEAVSDTALLLTGLLYGKLSRVKFTDETHTAILFADNILNLDGVQIQVTTVWLEAVLGMLLDVCLNGWSVTAHLDEDFENISITVAVLPPER